MSPICLSLRSVSSTSCSVRPFSVASSITFSAGTSLPCLFSRFLMASLMMAILFLACAVVSVAILSMSMVPVFSS